MYARSFVWRFLAALLILMLLAFGGMALFRAGWTQGFITAGLVSANGEAPAFPYGLPAYGWGYGGPFFGSPMGFLFGPLLCLFGLSLFFLLGGLSRFWGHERWRARPDGQTGMHPWDDFHTRMHERMRRESEGQVPMQEDKTANYAGEA